MHLRIQFVIFTLAVIITLPVTAQSYQCDPKLRFRTPTEVLVDHRAALSAHDWNAVGCNYSRRAVVISDQGVDQGREEIVSSLQYLVFLFGGVMPVITDEVATGSLVRVLFTLDIGWLQIPDGTDTYIIKYGRIVQQTSHGVGIVVTP